MSTPPFPPQPQYSPVPPPPPPPAGGSTYYNSYAPYQGYPPAPQPFDSYPPPPPPPQPLYDQNQPHHSHSHPHHKQGQASSAPRMYPRPMYSLPAKTSNAIFIKGLPYDLSVDEFMSIFSKFGEIATTFTSKISSRGFAFVTYYDIRSAINAVEQMKGQKVHDRLPVTTFSFNPPEYSRLNAHETSSMVLVKPIENITNNMQPASNQPPTDSLQPPDQAQSSTFNSFFGAAQMQPLNADSVAKALSAFGEIFKTTELGPNQFAVEYCDFRNARNAIASADKIDINGQKVSLESYVEPDEGVYYENHPQYSPPQSQMPMPPSAVPGYPPPPPPYQGGGPAHHHGNNGGGNRNNRNNNHGNRHGNRSSQPQKHQPYQQQSLPPPFMPPPQQLQQQVPSQQPQQPVMPPSMPPQYAIPQNYQQGSPQMQYMMQYPQGVPPPPPPQQQQSMPSIQQ